MPSRDEILRSLTGAWNLFLDRPDALRYFDISVEGFWRSFAAILLVAPSYVVIAAAERTQILTSAVEQSFDGGAFFLNKVLSVGMDWIAFPFLLALVVGPLGLSRTYAAFIVARTWGAVLALLPFVAIGLLYLGGILSAEAFNVISMVILIVVIRYSYLIARRALGAEIGMAIAIVLSDLSISILIMGLFGALLPYTSAVS